MIGKKNDLNIIQIPIITWTAKKLPSFMVNDSDPDLILLYSHIKDPL